MLFHVITVSKQVLVLFILIGIGFLLAILKVMSKEGARVCSDLALYLATPCVILKSFSRSFSPEMLTGFLVCLVAAVGIHLFGIALGWLLFRRAKENTRRVLNFAAVFSNAGFMAIPLQQAVLGEVGVFYGASYIAVFNLFMWTYGLYVISGDKAQLSLKKIVINPGVFSVFLGFILFLCRVQLPELILKPVEFLAGLNTPLPMLVIGFYLAGSNVLKSLKSPLALLAMAVKLLVIPLAALLALRLCGLTGSVPVAMVIAASAPTAAVTTMFSAKYGRNTELSVNLVSATTVLSILTMPLVIALAQL